MTTPVLRFLDVDLNVYSPQHTIDHALVAYQMPHLQLLSNSYKFHNNRIRIKICWQVKCHSLRLETVTMWSQPGYIGMSSSSFTTRRRRQDTVVLR